MKKILLITVLFSGGMILGYFLKLNLNDTNIINVQNYGVSGDDLKDDTAGIQAALNDFINTGADEIKFPQGTYLISSPILIKNSVTIRGYKAILKLSENFVSNNQGQGFFYAKSVNNITIDGITFNGNKDQISPHPVNNFVTWFENSSHVVIKNNHVINLNGRGANLNTAFGLIGNSDYGVVFNNLVENSDGGSVFFQGSNSVAKNNISVNLKDVALVANGTGSQKILFEDNIIAGASSGSIGIENGPSKVKIIGNRIYNFTDGYGIGVLSFRDPGNTLPADIQIKDNLIDSNQGLSPSNAIAIVKGDGVVVENNKIKNINADNVSNSAIWIGENVKNSKVLLNDIENTIAQTIISQSKENIDINKNNIIAN